MVILAVVRGGHFSEKTSVVYLRTDLPLNDPCNIPWNMALELSIKMGTSCLIKYGCLKLWIKCGLWLSHEWNETRSLIGSLRILYCLSVAYPLFIHSILNHWSQQQNMYKSCIQYLGYIRSNPPGAVDNFNHRWRSSSLMESSIYV